MADRRWWIGLGGLLAGLAVSSWPPPKPIAIAIYVLAVFCLAWGFLDNEARRFIGLLGKPGRPLLWFLDKADDLMHAAHKEDATAALEELLREFDKCFATQITPKTAAGWVRWYKRLRLKGEELLEDHTQECWLFDNAKTTGLNYQHAIDDNHHTYLEIIDAKRKELRNILNRRTKDRPSEV
jgi:hypothetical protein